MKINLTKLSGFITTMVLTFLIIRPQCIISAYPDSVGIFNIIQTILLMYFFIKSKFIIKGNTFLICMIFFYLYDLLNTIIQRSASPNIVIVTGVWAIFGVFVFMSQNIKYGLPRSIYFFSICVNIYLWINCILAYFYPHGLVSVLGKTGRITHIYFLGQENQLSVFFMLSIVLGICNFFVQEKISLMYKIFTFGVWPVSFFVLGDDNRSTTGMMGGFVLIFGYMMYKLFPYMVKKLVKPINSVVLITLFFIGVTKILTLDFVSNFIQNVLNKDITLSERTTIWVQVYDTLKNPRTLFLGMGEASGGAYITIWTGHTFSAHNLLLQVLLLGGMILFFIFLIMVIVMLKYMSGIKDNKAKAALSICLFVFFLMNMLEVYYFAISFLVMCIFYETGKYLSYNNRLNANPLERSIDE